MVHNKHYPKNRNPKNYHNNCYNKIIKVNKTIKKENNDIYNYYSNYRIEQNNGAWKHGVGVMRYMAAKYKEKHNK